MASSLLAKRISSSAVSFSQHHRHLELLSPLPRVLRLYLSTKPQPEKEKEKELPFIAQYLISSFGFSPDRALKMSTSKRLGMIKSAERPEAVVQFLKDLGLSDAQIKGAISLYPDLLRHNVEKSLKPNVLKLVAQGLSAEVLAQLIQYNPSALHVPKTPSRLLFWSEFTGKTDKALMKFLKRNHYLITFDIDKKIVPRMNLLKECGLSNQQIALMLLQGRSCMQRSLDGLKQVIGMVENMGIPHGSGMFFAGFRALVDCSKDTIKCRKEFFETEYGWSEQEICTAFCKFPSILQYSKANVKPKMDFLIGEVKLNPRSIVFMPVLLGLSLKKRLIPRHRVLSILATKKLKKYSFRSACSCSENDFIKIYIKPYEKDVPELSEAYFTALGGRIAT